MSYVRARMHAEHTAMIHHTTQGDAVWYRALVKKPGVCAVCTDPLIKGKRMFRPVSSSTDRICTPCVAELTERP